MLEMIVANKLQELHKPENKMTDLIDHRDNSILSSFKLKLTPHRAPTPPQTDDNEVDEGGSMDYRFEQARLESFENWPSPYVRPADLAAAGFYYTGETDKVRCFECKMEICRWEEGDDPMVEHQRWTSRCRFICKRPCGNVPIGADPSTIPLPRPRSRDVCGRYHVEYRLDAEADTHASSSGVRREAPLPSAARLGSVNLCINKKPDFPDYMSYEARLRTFAEWPKSLKQTKEQLANAGFFYTGVGDKTTCYHCGGGLDTWEPEDDPWVQHAKWFPTCTYVRMNKGQEFINNITGKHAPPLTVEETLRINLPRFTVNTPLAQKLEANGSLQPQVQPETSESAPGPSGSIRPTPMPRANANVESPKEPVPFPTANGNSSVSATEDQQPQVAQEQQQQQQPPAKKASEDLGVCKICYIEELGVVFMPCGHMACVKCAPGIMTCAMCRSPVTMTMRAFLS